MKWIIPLLALAVALAGCTNPDESETGNAGGNGDGTQQVDGTVEVVGEGNETAQTNTTANETNASG